VLPSSNQLFDLTAYYENKFDFPNREPASKASGDENCKSGKCVAVKRNSKKVITKLSENKHGQEKQNCTKVFGRPSQQVSAKNCPLL